MDELTTIKKIALLANVSTGTVDRVIHNRTGVAKKTRQKVLAIMQEISYAPNLNARNLVLNKKYKIAVLLPYFESNEYWELPAKGIKKASEEFSRHGIIVKLNHFDQRNKNTFNEIAAVLVNDGYDALVFAPVFIQESKSLAKLLTQRSIPFVLIDASLDACQPLTYIGQDAYKSGYLAAKLANLSGKNAKNVIINVNDINNNNVLQKRLKGYMHFFEQHQLPKPEAKVLNSYDADEMQAYILALLKQGYHQLNIFTPHSRAYLAAEAVEKYDLQKQVNIVGFDLINNNADYVKKGIIQFIIHQKPEIQGYKAIESLYRTLILNATVARQYLMPIDIITKENLEFFE